MKRISFYMSDEEKVKFDELLKLAKEQNSEKKYTESMFFNEMLHKLTKEEIVDKSNINK